MNIRERIGAFWAGEKPDQIPLTIYQNEWRHTQTHPAWHPLFERGLGVTWNRPSFKTIHRQSEMIQCEWESEGFHWREEVIRTPIGEISAVWRGEWQVKYWLDSPQDYRVMQFHFEHSVLEPNYEWFIETEKSLPDYFVMFPDVGPSPLMKIMLDYANLERFSYHLCDFEDEVLSLYDVLYRQFRRKVAITADGPGVFVSCPESFSVDMIGPKRFKEQILNVYEDCFPMLRSAGKLVGVHFDGKTRSVIDMVRNAPVDLIESLTPPPEGDQTLAEARQNWPNLLFWCNINVSSYYGPADSLYQSVQELIRQGAPDGRRLAFEVSEEYPYNWEESIPVVLDALRDAQI